MNTTEVLYRLLDFAEAKGLYAAIDRPYMLNRLLEVMQMDAPEEIAPIEPAPIPETATVYLEALCADACARDVIADSTERRDLFAAKLMGALTPSPAEVRREFTARAESDVRSATDWFYQLCRDTDYIRVDRIAKNTRYFADTACGRLEITINLSKPEKDPRDIAAQRAAKQTGYPKCMLCVENPGYAGRIGFPARQNHRTVPLTLNGHPWYMQYSPYLYYSEHCIVFNSDHVPMKIDRSTFAKLFDFVDQFPHYMLGSNADLPIVGGSILSHDHFQGGNYRFPMDDAPVRIDLGCPVDGVKAYLADWPMTCIVLKGRDKAPMIDLADRILTAWRGYSDPDAGILAESNGAPHNTITPILRIEDGEYKLQLVLRNNRTSDEHPLGIYHPHADLHHIKKENIGLIEVMGLFILPGRLKTELAQLAEYLTGARSIADAPAADSPLAQHYAWVCEIAQTTGTSHTPESAEATLRQAVADKCARVLADAGVYKQTADGDAALLRFVKSVF